MDLLQWRYRTQYENVCTLFWNVLTIGSCVLNLRTDGHMKRAARDGGSSEDTLKALLGSRARAQLLTLFFVHPVEEFYVRQIAATTRLSPGHIHRELARLTQLGLLLPRRMGREKLYRVNEQHPLYPELKRMVYKTTAFGDVLREALTGIPGVKAAFIYGSVPKGTERTGSDVDLFVLGSPDRAKLDAALSETEDLLGREVSLVSMTLEEWRRRRAAHEGFIEELLQSPKIFLVGDEQSLPRA